MAVELIAKPILENLEPKLRARIKKLHKQGIIPTLAIVWVGEDPNSYKFIKHKMAKASSLGIEVKLYHFSSSVSEKKLEKEILKLAKDKTISGIIIQLPLPKKLEADSLIALIPKEKDVDGLREESNFHSPTAVGIIQLLLSITTLKNKTIALVGQGRLVGKPLRTMLPLFQPKKIICIDNKTKSPQKLTQKADIIISATGVNNLITEDWLKKNAIVIDAGGGDVNQESVAPKASFLTPKIGAVGPLTIFFLLQNTAEAAEKLSKKFA